MACGAPGVMTWTIRHRNGRSMSMTTHEATLDADEVVARARSLRELIRAQQDEAEELGHYTAAVHERMIELGLYHLLTPRRYGGHEVSLKTWLRPVLEISAGEPGTAWCYCLGPSPTRRAKESRVRRVCVSKCKSG